MSRRTQQEAQIQQKLTEPVELAVDGEFNDRLEELEASLRAAITPEAWKNFLEYERLTARARAMAIAESFHKGANWIRMAKSYHELWGHEDRVGETPVH